MREYETTLIIQPEISDEGVATLQTRLDDVLTKAESTRLLYDDLGKRRLAYEIQNFQKGRYVMLQFLDEGAVIPDLERALRLEESILRFLTVQVSERVEDIEARKARAVEEERIRAEKAAERAAREAEDAARLEAEREASEAAAASAAAEAAKAAKAAEAAEAAQDEGTAEGSDESKGEEASKGGGEAKAEDAAEATQAEAEAEKEETSS